MGSVDQTLAPRREPCLCARVRGLCGALALMGLIVGGCASGMGRRGTDGGSSDAGVTSPDATLPTPDAGATDAGMFCTGHSQCDDGLACNGEERCEPDGSCSPGEPIECGDEIACTEDACVEPGQCLHAPTHALCGEGMVCSATSGCTAECGTPCELLSQCGCSDERQCTLNPNTNELSCLARGTAGEGEVCGEAACGPGLVCLSSGGGAGPNICVRWCESDVDCIGGPGSVCAYDAPFEGVTYRLCTMPCDPVTNTGCAPGLACTVRQETGRTVTECGVSSGGAGEGFPCFNASSCGAGLTCQPRFPAGNYCQRYCYGNSDCPVSSCTPLSPTVRLGEETLGYCS